MPSAKSATGAPVRLLPLDASPFAVYLLRGSGEGEPFLRAGTEPGRTRTWLAQLRSDTGAVLDRLVLKLPGEEREETPFPGDELVTNGELETEWAAVHADLLRLVGAAEGLPELVLPAPGPDGKPPLLQPLFFCATANRLFPIPCPRCLGPLHTCRDEARLAAAGLPSYASTAARFLACPSCPDSEEGEEGNEPRFWAGTADEARGLRDTGSLDDLRRSLETRRKKADGAAVLPAIPATPAKGWTVFNLHDEPFLLTRLAPVPFDDFVARLGGGGGTEGDTPEQTGAGLLFAAEGSGVDAVEILTLKLAAFLQTVRALRQHTLLLGRPHLDLHPEHLAVEVGPRGDFLPDLWSFRVKLLGPSPGRMARLGPGIELPLPPRLPRTPFAPRVIREARLARPSSGELLIERVVQEKASDKGEGAWRIEGTLLDPHGFYPPPGPRDWVQIAWPRDPFGSLGTAAAQVDPRVAPQSVEMAVITEPLELDPALARRLGKPGGFRVPGVRYRIYPQLGVPEDLWSLGVLLLRLVLVNDGQSLSALDPLLDMVPHGPVSELRGGRRKPDEILASAIAADPHRLAKENLFHQAVDRLPGRPNAVPDDLWTEVLRLALRLVARGPGFGLTPEPGGSFAWNEANPAAHLDEVLAQGEDLLRQLSAILFQRQLVHAEIRAVIAELLAE
jgi:hypothetical protein